jgi:hypothetical protein
MSACFACLHRRHDVRGQASSAVPLQTVHRQLQCHSGAWKEQDSLQHSPHLTTSPRYSITMESCGSAHLANRPQPWMPDCSQGRIEYSMPFLHACCNASHHSAWHEAHTLALVLRIDNDTRRWSAGDGSGTFPKASRCFSVAEHCARRSFMVRPRPASRPPACREFGHIRHITWMM